MTWSNFTILYWIVGGLLAVYLGVRVHRSMKARVEKARNDLAQNGYVRDQVYIRPLGDALRFWGKFRQPLDLYLQVSDLDPVLVAAGRLGVADIAIGDSEFDKKFVVRSNDGLRAAQVFDREIRSELMKHQKLRFRTGSLDSILGADYFPEERTDRDLRVYWMFEKAGIFQKEEEDLLLNLARQLVVRAEQNGVGSGKTIRTTFFEGR